MRDNRLERLRAVPRFARNEKALNRLGWGLSILVAISFMGFNLAVVWAPGWMGHPVADGTVISRGIVIAVTIIICAFLLTAYYMRAIGQRMDILHDEFATQGEHDKRDQGDKIRESGETRP